MIQIRNFPRRIYEPILSARLRETPLHVTQHIVSFTFDDAPASAFDSGAKILSQYGVRGTFYVSASECGTQREVGRIADRETVLSAADQGHEIANHGQAHVDLATLGVRAARRNVLKNLETFPKVMSNHFAYPYGSNDVVARYAIAPLVDTARGVQPGTNKEISDRLNLNAVPVYSKRGLEECLGYVDSCVADPCWLIFYTHDVDASPSPYGCTADELRRVVEKTASAGLQIKTIRSAWQLLKGAAPVVSGPGEKTK